LVWLFDVAGDVLHGGYSAAGMGFYAKFAMIKAVVGHVGLVWLAIIAVVLSLIGAFYYLRVVKTMYFDEPGQAGATVQSGFDARLIAVGERVAAAGLGRDAASGGGLVRPRLGNHFISFQAA
jgi:hypothetical protein